ncbi:hypothetical protein GRF29_106g552650 [Pseudopithomyces chartarum]|uniref:Uncharacterized protein n=1 Tax=Pseudopithomyces chartarum TaxID=1892770 RepID=A0AAN6RFV2_9PLEO|nr:hypothetical protein GRF29_106g552650 [Pseudopithomyces chartarum]
MDMIQNYLSLLHHLLPATVTNPLIQVVTTTFGIYRAAYSYLSPLLTQVVSQPDIASLLALLAILWLSLQILGMLYRSVMFWVRLAWTIVKYAAVVGVSLWVYNRGVDGAVEDAKRLAEVWMGEYQKFAGEAKAWKGAEEAQIRMQAKQRGYGWR